MFVSLVGEVLTVRSCKGSCIGLKGSDADILAGSVDPLEGSARVLGAGSAQLEGSARVLGAGSEHLEGSGRALERGSDQLEGSARVLGEGFVRVLLARSALRLVGSADDE